MATLVNWSGANYKKNVLNERTATSVLTMMQKFEELYNNLNLPDLLTAFATHSADTNNPHHITFSDVTPEILDAVYQRYAAITTSPLSQGDFTSLMNENGYYLVDLILRLLYNEYPVDAMNGSVAAPVYRGDTFAPYPTDGSILYRADEIIDDKYMTVLSTDVFHRIVTDASNTLSYFLNIQLGDPVKTFSFSITSDDGTDNPWLTVSGSNTSPYSLLFSGPFLNSVYKVTVDSSDGSDPSIVSFLPPALSVDSYKFAFSIQPGSLIVYFFTGGVLKKITMSLLSGQIPTYFASYQIGFPGLTAAVSAKTPFFDRTILNYPAGAKDIHIYARALDDEQIAFRLGLMR